MINLLPKATKDNVKYAKINSRVVRLLILSLLLCLVLATIFVFGDARLNKKQKYAEAKLKSSTDLLIKSDAEKKAQDLSDKIASANTILQRERRFSEVITNIASALPTGSRLLKLSLSNDPSQPLNFDINIATKELSVIVKKNLEEKLDESTGGNAVLNADGSIKVTPSLGNVNNIIFNYEITKADKTVLKLSENISIITASGGSKITTQLNTPVTFNPITTLALAPGAKITKIGLIESPKVGEVISVGKKKIFGQVDIQSISARNGNPLVTIVTSFYVEPKTTSNTPAAGASPTAGATPSTTPTPANNGPVNPSGANPDSLQGGR
jgi:hypothetical protein